jgi:hypothetical protein
MCGVAVSADRRASATSSAWFWAPALLGQTVRKVCADQLVGEQDSAEVRQLSCLRAATDWVTLVVCAMHEARVPRGGVGSLNRQTQKSRWFRIVTHSNCRMPWSSG